MQKREKLFFNKTWRAISLLGEGSYGKVYQAERVKSKSKEVCAIKNIKVKKTKQEVESLIREGLSMEEIKSDLDDVLNDCIAEIRLMQELKSSSYVVKIEDYEIIKHKDGLSWEINIRMELLQGLEAYFQGRQLTNHDILRLGLDIAHALRDCNKLKVIHRDIKPDNIFVNELGHFKLGDFGIARNLEKTTTGLSQKGTFNYIAPEVYKGDKYNKTVDVYSLGIVLYKYFNYNRLPFLPNYPEKITIDDRDNALIKRTSGEKIPSPINATKEEASVILKMLSYHACDRYKNLNELISVFEKLLENEERKLPEVTKITVKDDISISVPTILPKKGKLNKFKIVIPLTFLFVSFFITGIFYLKNNFIIVPDLVGKTSTVAIKKLDKLSLNDKVKYKLVKNDKKVGKVVQQNIKNKLVKKKTSIILYVGVSNEKVIVPDVVGLSLDDAIKELEELGLEISITESNSTTVLKNYVISQMTEAGSKLEKGKVVELLVSSGTSEEKADEEDEAVENKDSSNSSNLENDGSWSTWVSTLPDYVSDTSYDIDTKVQYSYRLKEKTSSYNSSLDGWILYNQELIATETTNEYESKTIPASEINNYKVRTSEAYYNYVHCYISSSGIVAAVKPNSDGSCPSGYIRHVHEIKPSSGTCYCSALDVRLPLTEMLQLSGPSKYDITYYIVKKTYRYYFYRWSSWSAYQDSAVSSSNDREVRKKTLYRYKKK